jgi:hypothetical protein
MASIEATRPAFWVQLAESTQLSALSIQRLNLVVAISRSYTAQIRLNGKNGGCR